MRNRKGRTTASYYPIVALGAAVTVALALASCTPTHLPPTRPFLQSTPSFQAVTPAKVDPANAKADPKADPKAAAIPAVTTTQADSDGWQTLKGAGTFSAANTRDVQQLAIQKSALDHEFLLQASSISQQGTYSSTSSRPRIVQFHRDGDRVVLIESSDGLVYAKDLPSTNILAVLPILSEKADWLLLDFNRGMDKYYSAPAVHSPEFDSADGAKERNDYTAQKFTASFLSSVRATDRFVEIHQIAQVEVSTTNNSSAAATFSYPTYEIRYFLEPYVANPGFQPLRESDLTHVGFFDATPQIETGTKNGKLHSYSLSVDIRKPVAFYLSANFPASYRQAAREGALYWNSVFGRQLVTVEDAPADVSAPNPEYNVIQWTASERSASAVTNLLFDPRTGEIKRASIYIPEAYAVESELAQNARDIENSAPSIQAAMLGPSPEICVQPLQNLKTDQRLVLSESGAHPTGVAAAQADTVALVVAHEVGHALGLRHNFAGSLRGNTLPTERDRVFTDHYLRGQDLPANMIFTSTVMDYLSGEEAALTGAQIRRPGFALEYDRLAIGWAYAGMSIPSNDVTPPYCSDMEADSLDFPDCRRNDSYQLPYLAIRDGMNELAPRAGAQIAMLFATTALKRPAASAESLQWIENLATVPEADISNYLAPWNKLVGLTDVEIPQVALIRHQYVSTDMLNEPGVKRRESEWFLSQLMKIGVESALLAWLPSEGRPALSIASTGIAAAQKVLDSLSQQTEYANLKLSDSEKAAIVARIARHFEFVEHEVLNRQLSVLAHANIDQSDATADFLKGIEAVGRALILTQVPAPAVTAPAATETALSTTLSSAPRAFVASAALRDSAFILLKNPSSALAVGLRAARKRTADDLGKLIEAELGGPLAQIDEKKLNAAQLTWLKAQQQLMSELSP